MWWRCLFVILLLWWLQKKKKKKCMLPATPRENMHLQCDSLHLAPASSCFSYFLRASAYPALLCRRAKNAKDRNPLHHKADCLFTEGDHFQDDNYRHSRASKHQVSNRKRHAGDPLSILHWQWQCWLQFCRLQAVSGVGQCVGQADMLNVPYGTKQFMPYYTSKSHEQGSWILYVQQEEIYWMWSLDFFI